MVRENQPDGTVTTAYVWADDEPVAQIDRAGNGTETLVYLHADRQNTPRAATNAAGLVAWRLRANGFAEGGTQNDPDGDGVQTLVRLRLPGQYRDGETGLHYNYFRDYDPGTGRYIESDPIGLAGGLNTYAYVAGNPLGFVDPFGLATQAEIDHAVSMIQRANPWTYPKAPHTVTMVPGLSDLFGNPKQGATDVWGNVEIRADLYGDSCMPVPDYLEEEFLWTLAHEMYHVNQGLPEQIMSKPPNELHRTIDSAAEALAKVLAPEFIAWRSRPQ